MKKLVMLGIDHSHYGAIISATQERDDIKLVAIAQETTPFADEIAKKFGVGSYRSYLECLDNEKPDVVGIAMYNGARGKWIAEALARNIPVITDKPLCTNQYDLQLIKKAYKKTQAPLIMMLTCRSAPVYIAMKEAIKAGAIGDVLAVDAVRYYALNRQKRPDWMFDSSSYGGPGLDILIHDYDLARWITGVKWSKINMEEIRTGIYDDIDFKDMATINAWDGICSLQLKMLWHSPANHKDRFTIYGTNGIIELPFESKIPLLIDKTGVTELALPKAKPFAEQFFETLIDKNGDFPITAEEAFEISETLISARNQNI